MARVTAERVEQTKRKLLEAARKVLIEEGFSGLSTRHVAETANTQMSQIQYHFGSKEGMILALFEYMNAALVARQSVTFERRDLSLAQKWDLACDYLDEDLASGYVRVLQELIAAGWTNMAIGHAVRTALGKWRDLLNRLVREFETRHGNLGPFEAEDIAALIGAVFIGSEAYILLGYEDDLHPTRQALRRFGKVIAYYENQFAKE